MPRHLLFGINGAKEAPRTPVQGNGAPRTIDAGRGGAMDNLEALQCVFIEVEYGTVIVENPMSGFESLESGKVRLRAAWVSLQDSLPNNARLVQM